MTTLNTGGLRTATLAARAGCSAQLVRNLERDGVLPPAPRTAAGYRQYGQPHLQTLLAYRALSAALGPVAAKALLRSLDPISAQPTLAAVDQAHAAVHRERRELGYAQQAAWLIAAEPGTTGREQDWMSVSELAEALGVRPSALRHWEAEGWWCPTAGAAGGLGPTRPPTCATPASWPSCAPPATGSACCAP